MFGGVSYRVLQDLHVLLSICVLMCCLLCVPFMPVECLCTLTYFPFIGDGKYKLWGVTLCDGARCFPPSGLPWTHGHPIIPKTPFARSSIADEFNGLIKQCQLHV